MRPMKLAYLRFFRWLSIFLLICSLGGYSLWITSSTGKLVVSRFAQLLQQPKLVAATLIDDHDWSTLARLYSDTYSVNSVDLTSPYTVRLARRDALAVLLSRQPDSRELNYQLLLIATQMQDKPAIESFTNKIRGLDPTFIR